MSLRNAVHTVFDQFGADMGMLKHSGSWYGRHPEVTTVLNLQKSQYGPKYFFNVAFWFSAAGQMNYPKEWECHIRTRIGADLSHNF